MSDQGKATKETAEEQDILVLKYPNGTSEDVELPAGTLKTLEDRATKEGLPFDEDYILNIIRTGLDSLKEKHNLGQTPEVE